MLFLFPAFDLPVIAPDGRNAGLVCIPWQESCEDWKLIVACPDAETGQYLMPYDRALHRFSFGEGEVPALLRAAEPDINRRVNELNML